jgi:mRNA interferase MazF
MKGMPLRGEIWYVKLPTDPPDKTERPVVIVSLDARNRHPRANTVLVAPLTGSIEHEVPTHIRLSPGETGLSLSSIRAEDVTVVRKESLIEPRHPLRSLSNTRICQVADAVRIAMGCPPK